MLFRSPPPVTGWLATWLYTGTLVCHSWALADVGRTAMSASVSTATAICLIDFPSPRDARTSIARAAMRVKCRGPHH